MSMIGDIAKFAAADVRYGVTIISTLVLGILVLLFKDLTPFIQNTVLPAIIVYTLGTAVIGHLQILITVSTNTKANANGEKARGIKESHLRFIMVAHVIWFILLILFIGIRANSA